MLLNSRKYLCMQFNTSHEEESGINVQISNFSKATGGSAGRDMR
jgi:hypothetical protein